MNLIQDTRVFSDALDRLSRPAGVSHVYNPLAYMRRAHEQWLAQFEVFVDYQGESVSCATYEKSPDEFARATQSRPYLILGMNPGPWGMVQTGVPFGDVANANIILGYKRGDQIPAPDPDRVTLHPKRPVQGFACTRREASGERLWSGLTGVFRPSAPTQGCPAEHRQGRHELYVDEHHTFCRACGQKWSGGIDRKPALDAVLAQCFAVNYCPLAYFAADPQGTNVTPDAFRKSGPYRDLPYAIELDTLCSSYIAAIVQAFRTRVVLAVGRYAETKAREIAGAMPADVRPKVVYLTHPSPLATRSAGEWAAMAQREMSAAGVLPEPRTTGAGGSP